MDHKCSMCCVCVCVCVCVCAPCLSICFSLSYLKPFWFGARGDCSQMLIRGRLQTAISLISLGEATWGSVRAKAEQRKHVRSYQPVAHSEKREAFSLFHLWKEEFKAERSPLPPPSSTVQWRSEIVYQDKRSRFRLLNLSDLPRSLPESRSVSESSNILKGRATIISLLTKKLTMS